MDVTDIKEVRHRWHVIIRRIQKYARKKYDARPMLEGYRRVTETYKSLGGVPGKPEAVLTDLYWEIPENYSRQHLNRMPIIGITDDFQFIFENPRVTARPQNHKIQEPVQSVQISNNLSHYSIKVCWTETEETGSIIRKVHQFFDEMGIKLRDSHDCLTSSGREYELIYDIETTEDAFRMLRDSVTVMLDILSDRSFNIGIIGKKTYIQ